MTKVSLLLSLAALAAGAGSALGAPPPPPDPNQADRVLVCHATGSLANPTVELYVPGRARPPARECASAGEYAF